jgi:hypothetical protein
MQLEIYKKRVTVYVLQYTGMLNPEKIHWIWSWANSQSRVCKRINFICLISWHLPQIDTNIQLSTWLYDKTDNLNVPIINFPHLDSNIPITRRLEFIFHYLLFVFSILTSLYSSKFYPSLLARDKILISANPC